MMIAKTAPELMHLYWFARRAATEQGSPVLFIIVRMIWVTTAKYSRPVG
jgi:hypothetical protein